MFSEKLRLLRQEKHISQEKPAFDINVARQTISKWENGVCLPDTEKLMDLCQYFDCSPDYLLYDRKPEEKIETPGKKNFWLKILTIVELVCLCFVLCSSWIIPAKKEIHQMAEVRNEYTQETAEEYVTYTIEAKGVIPFLKTYHLRVVFIILCIDLCVNLMFFVRKGMRRKSEEEKMDR